MADYRKMYYRMVDASERALELLEQRREEAREVCSDWQSWNLSACLAAMGR